MVYCYIVILLYCYTYVMVITVLYSVINVVSDSHSWCNHRVLAGVSVSIDFFNAVLVVAL